MREPSAGLLLLCPALVHAVVPCLELQGKKRRKPHFLALVLKLLIRRGKKKANFIECHLTYFWEGTCLLRRLFLSCSVIDILLHF